MVLCPDLVVKAIESDPVLGDPKQNGQEPYPFFISLGRWMDVALDGMLNLPVTHLSLLQARLAFWWFAATKTSDLQLAQELRAAADTLQMTMRHTSSMTILSGHPLRPTEEVAWRINNGGISIAELLREQPGLIMVKP